VKKRQSSQQCHLVLLGPTSIKAARKALVKLTPGVTEKAATYGKKSNHPFSVCQKNCRQSGFYKNLAANKVLTKHRFLRGFTGPKEDP